jgi:hypothetical protein
MAIFRFSAIVIKRSEGRSATAAAAYRAGMEIIDARTGETFDYTRKAGILHTAILAPDHAPAWMRDRAELWNGVEQAEKRKDAQLAREVQVALPHELTTAQQIALAREYVDTEFVGLGMVADLAIHAPDREGDQRNAHAHIMLTMREIDGDGFGQKAREWNAKPQLEHWREAWAAHVNRALKREGHEARIDHRTLEAQGTDREPSVHIGPNAMEMERRGISTGRGDHNREIAAASGQRQRVGVQLADINSRIAEFECQVQPSPSPEDQAETPCPAQPQPERPAADQAATLAPAAGQPPELSRRRRVADRYALLIEQNHPERAPSRSTKSLNGDDSATTTANDDGTPHGTTALPVQVTVPQQLRKASLSLRQRLLALFRKLARALTMRAPPGGAEPPRPARPSTRLRRRLSRPKV